MRRILTALLGTALGTTLLVGLKATGTPVGEPEVFAGAPFDPAGGTGGPGQPGVFGPSGEPGSTRGPGRSPGPGVTAQPGGTATTTTPAPGGTATTTTAPASTRTITGTAILVRTARTPNIKSTDCAIATSSKCNYQIQVQIQVVGTQVTAIAARYSPAISGDNKSCYLKAVSTLIQRAPTSYPANTAVSGATYSANAYLQSLQSALHQI